MRAIRRLGNTFGALTFAMALNACGSHSTTAVSMQPTIASPTGSVAFGPGSGTSAYCVDVRNAVIYQPLTVTGAAATFGDPHITQDTGQLAASVMYSSVPRTFEALVTGAGIGIPLSAVQRLHLGEPHPIRGARLGPGTYAVITTVRTPSHPAVPSSTLRQLNLRWAAGTSSGTASYVWNTKLGQC